MKNTLVLLIIGLFLILVQAMPWHILFPGISTLNLSLVMVIVAGIYDASWKSWFLAFTLGYVLESLSGSPRGLISLVNLLALLIMRGLGSFILFESLVSQVFLICFLCSTTDIIIAAATRGVPVGSLNALLTAVALRSIITALLSIPFLRFYSNLSPAPER